MNTQQSIRKRIENEFREGKLVPGTALDERALATKFKTSRTPVREALLLLSAQGLIDIIPRTGIYVKKLTAYELIAMMEGLAELEGVLARLAAQRINTQCAKEIKDAIKQTEKFANAHDISNYQLANVQFHEAIYRASGNPYIVEQTKAVRLQISGYRRHLFEKPGRLKKSQIEHKAVAELILKGEADKAADAMREHISSGGKAFADLILTNKI